MIVRLIGSDSAMLATVAAGLTARGVTVSQTQRGADMLVCCGVASGGDVAELAAAKTRGLVVLTTTDDAGARGGRASGVTADGVISLVTAAWAARLGLT